MATMEADREISQGLARAGKITVVGFERLLHNMPFSESADG